MYLLDTNVVSEIRRQRNGNARVLAWSSKAETSEFYLSSITLQEIEIGILRLDRHDTQQALILRRWFTTRLLPGFNGRILSVDAAVALRSAQLHVPDPRSYRDSLIAATALVHSLTVVTRNTGDFGPMGVKLLNPWEWVQE